MMRKIKVSGFLGILFAGLLLTQFRVGPAGADEESTGRNFFVNQGHPQASDDNPGTREAPWQTIGGNLTRLQAGDTVYVKEGIYREQVILSREKWRWAGSDIPPVASGESYHRMLGFVAYPGHDVVIKGSDVVNGWEQYRDDIWVKRDWPHNSQQVFCDGESLQQIAGEMPDMLTRYWRGRTGENRDDMRPGSFYYDGGHRQTEGKNLYVWLKDNGNPNERLMEVSVRPFLFTVRRGMEYVRISGFRMMHTNTSAVVNWAAVQIGGANNILENAEITWTDFHGLSVSGAANKVINTRSNYNGNTGLSGSGWGHRIINCETSHNNYRNWSPGWGAGGVKIIPFAHDIVMSGHTAAYNQNSCGIWFDWGMSNITIRNSVAHDNDASGIFYEIGERGVIKNNIVYRNGHRGIYVADSAETLVAHNLALENGMSGIAVIGSSRRGGRVGREEDDVVWVRNNIVWGNIMADNCHPDRAPTEPDGRGEPWTTRPELIMPDDDQRETNYNNISDYNLFYRSDGREIPFWGGWHVELHENLAAWREATGNDRHSIIAEPLFADRAGGNFRPAPDSPAIGLVRPQMSVMLDFDGNRRPYWNADERYYTAGPFEKHTD